MKMIWKLIFKIISYGIIVLNSVDIVESTQRVIFASSLRYLVICYILYSVAT